MWLGAGGRGLGAHSSPIWGLGFSLCLGRSSPLHLPGKSDERKSAGRLPERRQCVWPDSWGPSECVRAWGETGGNHHQSPKSRRDLPRVTRGFTQTRPGSISTLAVQASQPICAPASLEPLQRLQGVSVLTTACVTGEGSVAGGRTTEPAPDRTKAVTRLELQPIRPCLGGCPHTRLSWGSQGDSSFPPEERREPGLLRARQQSQHWNLRPQPMA